MITWKRLSVLLLLLLLLSVPIFSVVVLTDGEWAELDQVFTTLNDLLEKQAIQLELAETQLAIALQEIEKLELSLKKGEKFLKLQEKEQKRKTVVWVVGSLLAGVVAGIIFE